MPRPAITATPYDPLLTYQFRIQLLKLPADPSAEAQSESDPPITEVPLDDRNPPEYVAGVRRISGLTLTVAATETWQGGNSLHRYANPHRAVWEPILLEQGISTDTSLQDWAEAGVEFLRTGKVTQPVKRNVMVDVFASTRASQPTLRFLIFNAWISKYQAVPRLDAMADEVALLSVELTHHGWRRDELPPPPPTGFDTPD